MLIIECIVYVENNVQEKKVSFLQREEEDKIETSEQTVKKNVW